MTSESVRNKEHQLAHSCLLTVMTGWVRVTNGAPPDLLADVRPKLAVPSDKFDLLAVRNLETEIGIKSGRELVVADVNTAIGLHHAEALHIKGLRLECADELVADLPDALDTSVELMGDASPVERLPVVITCMDWRIHGGGAFARLVQERLGYSDFYLMTVPGVAKDLGDEGPRLDQVTRQLESYREYLAGGLIRVHLISHTDCGKYGGSCAFGSATHEQFDLQWDLLRASRQLVRRVPGIKVGCHVLRIDENRPSSII